MPAIISLALTATPIWQHSAPGGVAGAFRAHIRGLKKGQWYVLATKGDCRTKERRRVRKWKERINASDPEVFGVDFVVSIEGVEPMHVDHQERTTRFRADRGDPEITIEDTSTPQAGTRCVLTHVEVREPAPD